MRVEREGEVRTWQDSRPRSCTFGGKSGVSSVVWKALGDVEHYVEPFAGSLAVLLGRPSGHRGRVETVNDYDAMLCNFWRALQADPEGVARYCDLPVCESDLTARHLWLVNEGKRRLEALDADPDFYDAKVAGWWVWGINAWIGSGWCSGGGPWVVGDDGKLLKRERSRGDASGIHQKRPHLGSGGQGTHRKSQRGEVDGVPRQLPMVAHGTGRGTVAARREDGVNRKLPHLDPRSRGAHRRSKGEASGVHRKLPHFGGGKGTNRNHDGVAHQRPHLGTAGQGTHRREASGVHRKLPSLGHTGRGTHRKTLKDGCEALDLMPRSEALYRYLAELARRLRDVRVCRGDWARVVTDGALSYGSSVGVFFDPPYLGEVRSKDLYAHDDHEIAHDVRKWAIEHGDDPRLRIILAGYETEHGAKMPKSWSVYAYKARASYQSAESAKRKGSEGGNLANRKLERLWFSPHCRASVKGLLY